MSAKKEGKGVTRRDFVKTVGLTGIAVGAGTPGAIVAPEAPAEAAKAATTRARQITGVPGSPDATMTIDGKQLPPPDPKFCGVIEEKAPERGGKTQMKKAMSGGLKRTTKARVICAALSVALVVMAGMAAPSMAQEPLEKDLDVIRACGADVWHLCSHELPYVGRVKACVQNKMGRLSKGCLDLLLEKMAGSTFKVCKNQTYALCAAARCNVYDGVAYCQCDVKHGNSISLPFPMGNGTDVCSTNASGADNKYMISTYSLPESIASPQGGGASYTCSGDDGGAYAQCDGGICFESTGGTTFPGFDKPVPKGQIICSCPITKSNGQSYQILGPYPCDRSFFRYCKGRHRQQQDRLDDVCRRSDRHGSGASSPSQRQSSTRQPVP